MADYLVGLTGGIGSGKSAACIEFAKQGIAIIDADIIARQIVEPNQPAYQAIVDQFGSAVTLADKTLNRAELRQQVFSNPDHKIWLDNLLHPIIRQQLVEQAHAATSPYAVLAIPLLVENNLASLVNRVLVIDCTEQQQIQHATKRDNCDKALIEKIINSQASRQQRQAVADDIIENNGTLMDLQRKIADLHAFYLTII